MAATRHEGPLPAAAELPPARVFVALGSNLGASAALLRQAMDWLAGGASAPLRRSSLWRTTPVDCPPGSPPFLNAVVELALPASLSPESFLEKLQALEQKAGRQPKKILNEPRPLDLDLIAFGEERRNAPDLVLPHPRAHLRRFVLEPLCEIAPALILPGQTKTASQLLAQLSPGEVVERIP